ncbi:hypothetical protein BH11PSE9_BH11PSE9_06540 [soil metagenome]
MSGSALPTFRFRPGARIVQAQPPHSPAVTLASPALDVMTDLTRVKAATTEPMALLRQAELRMIHLGVRLLFVVSEMPSVEGLVTASDLRGEKPLRLVNQRGAHYDDLTVADVMTELSQLYAVDLSALRSATVGNVVETLRKYGRQHLLVVQHDDPDAPMSIRGVFSQTQVERQLGTPIDMVEIAMSFAEIGQAIAH